MTMTAPTALDPTSGRERILGAAAQLFLTHGYAETSLRTIADAVGMKPASIYHHFESKDALLTEILSIGMEAISQAFDDAAERLPPDATGLESLRGHVSAHLEALFAHQAFTAAHVTVFPFAPPEVRAGSVPRRDAYEAKWTDLLRSIAPAADVGTIRLARLTLFGAMNTTLQWFDPAEGSLDDLGRRLADLLWPGLDEEDGR